MQESFYVQLIKDVFGEDAYRVEIENQEPDGQINDEWAIKVDSLNSPARNKGTMIKTTKNAAI